MKGIKGREMENVLVLINRNVGMIGRTRKGLLETFSLICERFVSKRCTRQLIGVK
jgi:hypothetical protein